jgi:hypothetical protein
VVARCVGKENNASSRVEAMEYLNDIISELNTYSPWMMLRGESTGNAFTANTNNYVMTSDLYRLESVYITDASGNRLWNVEVHDEVGYRRLDPLDARAAYRHAWVRNVHANTTITFNGTIGSDAPTNLWNYTYIKRIPLIASEGSVIDIPREMERAIVAGAKYLMSDNAPTAEDSKVQRRFADYLRLVKRCRDIDRNDPAQRPRWQLAGGANNNESFPYFLIPF